MRSTRAVIHLVSPSPPTCELASRTLGCLSPAPAPAPDPNSLSAEPCPARIRSIGLPAPGCAITHLCIFEQFSVRGAVECCCLLLVVRV